MLQSVFFYLLLLLPGIMASLALILCWPSLNSPALFAVTAFLSLYGLQNVIRWLTRLSLHNFLPVNGISGVRSSNDLSASHLFSYYYGLEALLLIIVGSLFLYFLSAALAKP